MPIKPNLSSVYAKGVISLFKGSFWAQALGLIGTLVIANLYGSESLGIFSKFLSISSILAIFYTLRLESAFVLSDDTKDLKVVFSSIVYTVLIGSLITILVALILPNSFFESIKLLRIYLIFSVLGGILKAIENAFISYLLKQKLFKIIASSRVIFTLVRYAFQVGLFYLIEDLGLILGFVIALLILLIYFYRSTGNLFELISLSHFKSTLKENQNLVSYGVLSDNLNAVNLNIIPVLAGIYFADNEIGWFFLAGVLLSVPLRFINSSFSSVFFLKASEIYNSKKSELFSFLKKWTIQLSLGILIPYLGIALLCEPFIEIALKDEWISVVAYIQWLSLLFYLRAIYNPISHLEEVLKKNHIGLIFNIYLFVVNVSAILYGALIIEDFFYIIKVISLVLPIGYIAIIAYFLLITYKLRQESLK